MKAVELKGLTKFYGKSRGIEDITFDIEQGETFGFLGPNGAGKSTALRTLVGLIFATSGEAKILGEDALIANPKLRARIGYLPGSLGLYKQLTGWEALTFIAKMRGKNCDKEIKLYAERLELDLHKHIHDLSKGNRQKVGVIQAFMHQPEVLFLDEPTSGLDPLVQREFEAMLDEVKARGGSVMLSSHVLSEVDHLANRIAVIKDGRLVVVDEISKLKSKAIHSLVLTFDQPVNPAIFAGILGVSDVLTSGNVITCKVVGNENHLLTIATANGVTNVRSVEQSLDEIFLGLVAGAQQ